MMDDQLSSNEMLRFKSALKEGGYDPADFKIELDSDTNKVTVTRLSNGKSRVYDRIVSLT